MKKYIFLLLIVFSTHNIFSMFGCKKEPRKPSLETLLKRYVEVFHYRCTKFDAKDNKKGDEVVQSIREAIADPETDVSVSYKAECGFCGIKGKVNTLVVAVLEQDQVLIEHLAQTEKRPEAHLWSHVTTWSKDTPCTRAYTPLMLAAAFRGARRSTHDNTPYAFQDFERRIGVLKALLKIPGHHPDGTNLHSESAFSLACNATAFLPIQKQLEVLHLLMDGGCTGPSSNDLSRYPHLRCLLPAQLLKSLVPIESDDIKAVVSAAVKEAMQRRKIKVKKQVPPKTAEAYGIEELPQEEEKA